MTRNKSFKEPQRHESSQHECLLKRCERAFIDRIHIKNVIEL